MLLHFMYITFSLYILVVCKGFAFAEIVQFLTLVNYKIIHEVLFLCFLEVYFQSDKLFL